jgi:hypothetical protein
MTWFRKPIACSIFASFSTLFFSLRTLAADGAGAVGAGVGVEEGFEDGCFSFDMNYYPASFP